MDLSTSPRHTRLSHARAGGLIQVRAAGPVKAAMLQAGSASQSQEFAPANPAQNGQSFRGIERPSRRPEELLRGLAGIVAENGLAGGAWPQRRNNNAGMSIGNAGHQISLFQTEGEAAGQSLELFLQRHKERFSPSRNSHADGFCMETFASGAKLIKDDFNSVLEVKCACGESILFNYGGDGRLESFVRIDSNGRKSCLGFKDRRGVVVRGFDGQARVLAESMAVDAGGSLVLYDQDGQVSSVDLVRAVQVERRRVRCRGQFMYITAVFAHDGFRLVTHFQDTASGNESQPDAACRFYGRDGSLVEFACREDLFNVRPSRVFAPGSMHVKACFKGKRRSRTAWQSVLEYFELLL